MHKDVGKRVMALLLSICMIAGMVDWSGFTVRAATVRKVLARIEINASFDKTYTGSPLKPTEKDITVYAVEMDEDENRGQEYETTDYEILTNEYGTAVNAGQSGSIKVRGTGDNEANVISQTFQIEKKDITNAQDVTIDPIQKQFVTQNGWIRPVPTVRYTSNDGEVILKSSDYNCTYSDNCEVTDANGSGTGTITIDGTGTNYEGQQTVTFEFEKMEASRLKIELQYGTAANGFALKDPKNSGVNLPFRNFNGTPISLDKKKDVIVKYEQKDGTEVQVDADDFELIYTRDGKTTTDYSSVGRITVQARGIKGAYNGLTSSTGGEYYIRKNLNPTTTEVPEERKIQFEIATQIFPGSRGTLDIMKNDTSIPDEEKGINTQMRVINPDAGPDVAAKMNSEKFTISLNDEDWRTETPDDDGLVHTTVSVAAIVGSGYFGTNYDVPVDIKVTELSEKMVTIENQEQIIYDGKTDWLEHIINQKWLKVEGYEEGVDYSVEKANPSQVAVNQGTYNRSLIVRRLEGGQLTGGPVYISITVQKRDVNDKEFTVNVIGSYVYNGQQHKPTIEVKYKNEIVSPSDYSVSYGTNTNAGQGAGSVTITGQGNFEKSVTEPFNIARLHIDANNTQVKSPVGNEELGYSGSPRQPDIDIVVTVRPGTTYQLKPADYEVEYKDSNGKPSDHINATLDGDYITMIIKGREDGNFEGEFRSNFKITPQEINNTNILIDPIPKQVYTGTSIEPAVTNVRHSRLGKLLTADYDVDYGENTKPGLQGGTVEIIGRRNYTGTATFYFDILKCNIGDETTDLKILGDGPSNETYDFINRTVNGVSEELYYPYNGKEIEVKNLRVSYGEIPMNMGKDADYTVSYEKNATIGTAKLTIHGQGENYEGSRTVEFRIKGNLTPLNQVDMNGWAEARIDKDQIYNAGVITPTGTIVKFYLKNASQEVLTLKEGVDFTVENADKDNVTQVGTATAEITGIGDYYGGGSVLFNVIPLNLTDEKDNLESVHKYLIGNIESPYIYSGLAIKPVPTITHNGTPVNRPGDYTLSYYKDGEEITGDDLERPFEVGDYSVRINGAGNNYEGFTDKEYKIEQYDIGAEYANVEIENVANEVVLDDIKFAGDASPGDAARADSQLAEMGGTESTGKHEHGVGIAHSEDEVVWKDLKVKYTPVGIQNDANTYDKKELVYGVDYTVEYANNKTLGTATYTIKGKGNFTGEIKGEFKILGDLAGKRTKIEVEDCVFTPATGKEPANKTEVKVTYTHTVDGREDTTTFSEGTDFILKFSNNEKATHPYPGREEESALDKDSTDGGWVIVKENLSADGKHHLGLGSGTNEKNPRKFKIYQRDISQYGEGTDLTLSGLKEEGYEYTGSFIIPDLQLACKAINLTYEKLEDGQQLTGSPDYIITAKNNKDVWTDSEETTPNDNSKRVLPEFTVAARTEMRDGKALYNGNYCGTFSAEFQINPRVVNQATIDTDPAIVNERTDLYSEVDGEWVCNYDRAPHTFPKWENGAEVSGKNGLVIKWSKDGTTVELKEGEDKDYTIGYEDNTKIGRGIIQVHTPMKSNYQTEEAGVPYEKYFKIMASIEEVDRPITTENPLEHYMDLEYEANVPYDRPVTYPDLQFIDRSGVLSHESDEAYILEKDKDFVIVTKQNQAELGVDKCSTNNENVTKEGETATVVVKGIGYYNGVVERTYKIIPKDMNDKGIVVEFVGSVDYENFKNAYIFNGNEQKPSYNVYNNNAKDIEGMETDPETGNLNYDPYQQSKKMRPGVDYEFVRWENNVGPSGEKGPAKLVLRGKGNYTGERAFEFNIVLRQMEDLDCKVTGKAVYNGLEQEPAVEVSYRDENGKTVILNPETDFDAVYTNNVNAASKDAEQNPPTITLTGKGGYEGAKTVTFDIEARDINSKEITATGVALYDSGNPVVPRLTVKDAGILLGTTLNPETDYKIVGQSDHVDVGQTGTVDIEGQGNYKGVRKGIEFRIIPPNGVLQIEAIPEQDFINQPIKPEVTVSLLAEGFDTAVPLTADDYDVVYTDNLKAGTATVTVTGKEPFSGTATAKFVIRPKSIGADGAIAEGITVSDIGVAQYTGSALTPKVTLTFTPPQAAGKEDDPSKPVELVQGRDFTVDYVNNAKVGVAKAVVKGIGNYTGSIEKQFEIHANMSMVKIEPIPMQNYTGSAVTPLPVVSLGGQTLVLDKDYRVSYSNNVDRGTATITITGIEPWYVGKRTVNFDIARELSEKTAIRGVASVYTYTGSPITPPIRVEEGGALLVKGVDYEASYSQNVDAGTATVVIKGIGKYTGTASTTFQIMPQQLGRAKVSPISDQVYNGKEQNPPITVTSGDKTLQNGKDYSLVYVNSAKPGMASVIIKGEGNYTGTQTVNYRIKVPGMTGVKFSKYTSSSVTISWTKNSVVTGYEIYNAKNRRALRVKKSSTTKGTVKKLKAGTAATFRVRAYVNKDGQYYYGPFTSIKTATAPSSTKISSLASKKKKQVVVKWKKVKGATQYEVYRATSKKGKYKKIGTSKKTTYTDKKATGGKKYYYKVRVCKKINKKNYYSSYSAVKSVKAKK